MNRFKSFVYRFIAEEDGPTAVEYAVMLALIVMACISAVRAVGSSTAESLSNSGNRISSMMGGS